MYEITFCNYLVYEQNKKLWFGYTPLPILQKAAALPLATVVVQVEEFERRQACTLG